MSPPFRLHRLHAAGTKRTAGRAGVQGTKAAGVTWPTTSRAETLAGLGEFAVIDRLVAGRDQPPIVAAWAPATTPPWWPPRDGRTVVSTDMLVEGRHFRLDWSTPHDVGRKAIAQNAADIEAMGAAATAFVVAFGAPGGHARRPDAASCPTACGTRRGRFGAGIVGGDLVSAPQWVISVTALGDLGGPRTGAASAGRGRVTRWRVVGRSRPVSRRICACGTTTFDDFDDAAPPPSGAASRPTAQGRVAADAGATAMTDVSDGLLADLGHIADASGVGIDAVARRAGRRPRRPRRSGRGRGRGRRGRGCSAAARTTRWSRRSPARRPRAGERSASVLDGPRASVWSTAPSGDGSRGLAVVLSAPQHARLTSRDRTPALHELVDDGWADALEPVADQVAQMGEFLRAEIAAGQHYLPAGQNVLRAFTFPFDQVRVLIVGQDPYPTPGHAVGLSFSVAPDVRPLPRSLDNIFKEYGTDLGHPAPATGDLTPWASAG